MAVLSLPLVLAGTTASAQPYRHTLSSGLFSLPAGAHSVDWALVNDSAVSRNVRVTVYRHGVGVPRVTVAPGALTVTIAPEEATHNANSVGGGLPFQPGFYYEVVLETNSLRVLPVVNVWQDAGNTVIPGSAIPAGSWVRIR
jgi:hypothetical protein